MAEFDMMIKSLASSIVLLRSFIQISYLLFGNNLGELFEPDLLFGMIIAFDII